MWISRNELSVFYKLVIWITRSQGMKESIILLNERIVSLVNTNGFSFTFTYLKEAFRLTIRALAGQPEQASGSNPRVAVDPNGFPKIVPLYLRRSLMAPGDELHNTRAVLTMLSVYRVFSVTVKPSLESITAPFNGVSKTLDKDLLKRAIVELGFTAKFGKFKGFISESAGPNFKYATLGCLLDLVSLLCHPRQLLAFIQISLISKSYGYLLWFLILSIFGIPFILLYLLNIIKISGGKPLTLGKLSVVYDQAGKARIVAITNWWIQLALRPLHQSIFGFLKTLKQDGTFNQEGPLFLLYKTRGDSKHNFSCFDLSSATDRLPIDLQSDILSFSKVNGNVWRRLLDFSWVYRSEYVKYSVGQPMGAYSSWGMLAVTHHVIVKVAALQAGISNFERYAILGDDIVIHNDIVSENYLNIMKTLGVSINMSKSVVSKDIIEFAKRWIAPYGEMTPIGPGNLLFASRYPHGIGNILIEARNKGYIINNTICKSLIDQMPKRFRPMISLAFWTYFGVSGSGLSSSQVNRKNLLTWYTPRRLYDPAIAEISVFRGILDTLINDCLSSLKKIDRDERILHSAFLAKDVTGKSLAARILSYHYHYWSKISPIYWTYNLALSRARTETHVLLSKCGHMNQVSSYDKINEFLELCPPAVSLSERWYKPKDGRRAQKDFARFYHELNTRIWRQHDDLLLMWGPF